VAAFSDISISQTSNGNTITFTADSAYTNYKWYVDDVLQSSNNNTFAFDISTLQNGVYSIYLEAKKDGRYYSSTIDVNVGGNN
jgi:hypothetical protein